jgi:dynein heavy chain, axonemal
MKPRERPITPENSERGKRVQDENKWVWDLYEALRGKLEKAIEPLAEYLKSFNDFKKVLQMKPDQEARALEMEENPREVEALRDLILQTREQEKKLREAIPETIHVSFFNIQCKDLLEYLQDKYHTYIKNIIDIIANRARNETRTIFHTIEAMKAKVREQPKDIDKLTEIKEYMNDKLPGKVFLGIFRLLNYI